MLEMYPVHRTWASSVISQRKMSESRWTWHLTTEIMQEKLSYGKNSRKIKYTIAPIAIMRTSHTIRITTRVTCIRDQTWVTQISSHQQPIQLHRFTRNSTKWDFWIKKYRTYQRKWINSHPLIEKFQATIDDLTILSYKIVEGYSINGHVFYVYIILHN